MKRLLPLLVAAAALETQPQLPKVPKVFNAGPDGMPHLPDADTLLEKYQDVNHDLNFAAGRAGFAEHLASVELDVPWAYRDD